MSYAVHKLLLMHILVAYFPFLFYFYPIFFSVAVVVVVFAWHVQVCELTEAKSFVPTRLHRRPTWLQAFY